MTPQAIYIGLDLRSSVSQQVVVNADGSLVSSRGFPTSENNLRDAFAEFGADARVHMEAGERAAWAHSVIRPR